MTLAAPFIRSIKHRITTWRSVRADLADVRVRDCLSLVLNSAETEVTQVNFLGRGGDSLVFRAVRLGSPDAALKVPRYRDRGVGDRSAAELALRREAVALGIARITVVPRLLWRSPAGHCFLRELVEGVSVARLVSNHSLQLAQRRDLLVALLETGRVLFNEVHNAHRGNFVVRDFKPRNLVRDARDGRIFFIDLGALRREGADAATKDSVCRLGTGKWQFWAPEQLIRQVEVDRRADYFALAATGFAILSGSSPYTNLCAVQADALRAYLTEYDYAVRRLQTIASAIKLPRNITAFLSAALHPDVDARPSTFGDSRICWE